MTYPAPAPCPCCCFPTLEEPGDYEVCPICYWEDDGQGDHNADEVTGGPNHSYSLTQARKNFADHGHMFDVGKGTSAVERPSSTRRMLIGYLSTVDFDPRRADAVRLAELLRDVG